ncbi:MAG TPA: energy transducer TonB [Gemmatimonadaceae bacterium]|nr:energy transducer TonB [Gemmatimonadaceae bacterium]
MLEVLLESRGVKQPRPVLGAVVSAMVHATIVAIVVVGGHRLVRDMEDVDQKLAFLVPVDRGTPTPEQHLTYVAVGGGISDNGVAQAAKQQVDPNGSYALPQIAGSRSEAEQPVRPMPEAQVADNAYSVVEVDSAATRDPTSAAPAYPQVMMAKGIEGYAAMRFVVDSTGLIDLGTVELLQGTHAEFVQAVREAMPHMRFRPAKMGTLAVRQLAEQLFKFEIRHVASSAEPGRKKP